MNDKAIFQGQYTTEVRDFLTAAAVSGLNGSMYSEPGWGKTRMAISHLFDVWGEDHVSIIRFSPTSPPEVVKGVTNIEKFLNESKLEEITDGTPYDLNVRAVLADELPRASDPIFDLMLDVTDRILEDRGAYVISTSNFTLTSERTAALRDRFGLAMWLAPAIRDVPSFVNAIAAGIGKKTMHFAGDLPDAETIESIREMKPSNGSVEAIGKLLDTLVAEATEQLFKITPRRLDQWTYLLYRLGVYYNDGQEFTEVPTKATNALRWAYPLMSQDEAQRWASVSNAVSDVVGTAVQELMHAAYAKIVEIEQQFGGSQKQALAMHLGDKIGNFHLAFKEIGDDDRVKEAIKTLTIIFERVSRGESAFTVINNIDPDWKPEDMEEDDGDK